MILCDVNVWLAMALTKHRHHQATCQWFANGDAEAVLLFCRMTQLSLVRLLTTEAVLSPYGNRPLCNSAAWEIYLRFLAHDRICIETTEPPGTEAIWHRLAARDTASPKLWMDAYLAAFAIAGGHRLATLDAGFRQFDDLDLVLLSTTTLGASGCAAGAS